MPRVNLLVADDVGLGKTIEAGLVMQELILRHRAQTALVICPAPLQQKWQVDSPWVYWRLGYLDSSRYSWACCAYQSASYAAGATSLR